ncbi:MAG: alpha/beta hydrolase [Gammaproteobacteria bacterium]|nr:alpha/beta hydrolase [Gammaproteobacteria bacterium]
MNQYQLRAIRLFFWVVSRIAPNLAIRLSARLFTTPFNKRRPSDMEEAILRRASRFSIPYPGHGELAGYRWGEPEKPAVLFVHGWTGTASTFVMFIEPLLKRGFQVIAYDGPAHGASPGKTANLIEWTDGLVAAVQALHQVHCIVGHSLGGAAILIASSAGLKTNKLVLLAPLSDIVSVTESFARHLAIPLGIITRMRDFIAKNFQQRLHRYGNDWSDIFQSDFKVPTLILHDKLDKEIPWVKSQTITQQWPWAEFITTEGLGHRRILINTEVINQVIEFVAV